MSYPESLRIVPLLAHSGYDGPMFRAVARAYQSAFSGLPRECWILAGALLVNRSGTMVLPFLSLWLTQERGLALPRAAVILALYGFGSIAGSGLGGGLSDRIGATRMQQISLAGGGVALLWLGTLQHFATIAGAAFVAGLALDAFRPAVMADMARRAPPSIQVRAFALLRLAANLGMGIGPAVGGFLALVGYRWLFVADALTCWLAAGVLTFALTRPAATEAVRAGDSARAGGSVLTDVPFLLLLGLSVALASVFFQTLSTLPLYLHREHGFREDKIGMLLALNPLIIVFCEMILVHWAERRDRLRLIGLGALLICTGFGLIPLDASTPFLAFTIAIWTLGEMLALPQLNTVVARRAGPGRHGHYMGMYTMSFSAAFAFAPGLGTWIYDHFGPRTLWLAIGALGPALFAWALWLRRLLVPAREPARPAC
jgi:predicted MFS family arabinose efflux permease